MPGDVVAFSYAGRPINMVMLQVKADFQASLEQILVIK